MLLLAHLRHKAFCYCESSSRKVFYLGRIAATFKKLNESGCVLLNS